jgi:hypothetical protein
MSPLFNLFRAPALFTQAVYRTAVGQLFDITWLMRWKVKKDKGDKD